MLNFEGGRFYYESLEEIRLSLVPFVKLSYLFGIDDNGDIFVDSIYETSFFKELLFWINGFVRSI